MFYHIKENGDPALCKARPGNCPLKTESGEPQKHYITETQARVAFEGEHLLETLKSLRKEPLDEEFSRTGYTPSKEFDFITSDEAWAFTNGDCLAFASETLWALERENERLGLEGEQYCPSIEIIFDEEYDPEEDWLEDYSYHYVVFYNGKYIDAKGVHDPEEYLNQIEKQWSVHEPVTITTAEPSMDFIESSKRPLMQKISSERFSEITTSVADHVINGSVSS